MKAICLWSGPRNVSTALMYSFAQRPDTTVVDEPLYGHFLRVTGTIHPGREEILAAVDCDGNRVMQRLLEDSAGKPGVLFVKQMAHHLVDLDLSFTDQTNNLFLIRDPQQMLPSLTIQLPQATLDDTGLKQQWQLLQDLQDNGQNPIVIDSRELLIDPASVLQDLCKHLGLDYSKEMLTWSAGAIKEDGIWAPYWYHAVHQSTGFSPYVEKSDFPKHLEPLLKECAPWYEKLFSRAIRASTGD